MLDDNDDEDIKDDNEDIKAPMDSSFERLWQVYK